MDAEIHELPVPLENHPRSELPKISTDTMSSLFKEYAPSDKNASVMDKKSIFHRLRYGISPKKRVEEKQKMQEHMKDHLASAHKIQEEQIKLQKKYPLLYRHFEQFLEGMQFPDITSGNAKESGENYINFAKANMLEGFGMVLMAYETQDPWIL
jgi:hypothetical protein